MIVRLRIVDDMGAESEAATTLPAVISAAQVGDTLCIGERRLKVVSRDWTLDTGADLTMTAREARVPAGEGDSGNSTVPPRP